MLPCIPDNTDLTTELWLKYAKILHMVIIERLPFPSYTKTNTEDKTGWLNEPLPDGCQKFMCNWEHKTEQMYYIEPKPEGSRRLQEATVEWFLIGRKPIRLMEQTKKQSD